MPNGVYEFKHKVHFVDRKDTLKFQNNVASGEKERKSSEVEHQL